MYEDHGLIVSLKRPQANDMHWGYLYTFAHSVNWHLQCGGHLLLRWRWLHSYTVAPEAQPPPPWSLCGWAQPVPWWSQMGKAFLPSWESLWTAQCNLTFPSWTQPAPLPSLPQFPKMSLCELILPLQTLSWEELTRQATRGAVLDLSETVELQTGEEMALPSGSAPTLDTSLKGASE